MSAKNKLANRAQAAKGKAKQVAGTVTGNRRTDVRGRRSQVGADLKNAGEQLKDAGRKTKDAFKH